MIYDHKSDLTVIRVASVGSKFGHVFILPTLLGNFSD